MREKLWQATVEAKIKIGTGCLVVASTLGLELGMLIPSMTSGQEKSSSPVGLALSQGPATAKSKPPEPKEKVYPFEMREKPWAFVIDWFSAQTKLPFTGSFKPAGTFTFIPPPRGPRDYAIPQIIDILNERLMASHKAILIRDASSFTIERYDQPIGRSLLPRIRLEELDTRGNTELACLLLPLKHLDAEGYAPTVKQMMGPQGRVVPLELSNHLHLVDHVGRLRKIVQAAKAIQDSFSTRTFLDQGIHLDYRILPETGLAYALYLAFLPFKLEFEFDGAAFQKNGVMNIEEEPVSSPRIIGVTRAIVLQLLLSQADAEFTLQGDRIVIVPMGQGKPYVPRDSEQAAQQKKELALSLATKVTLEVGIDENTPLRDVLEFFSDRYDLTILTDTGAFRRAGVMGVEGRPIKSKPQLDKPFAEVLQSLLDQVNGTYEIQSNAIVVVPHPRRLPPNRDGP